MRTGKAGRSVEILHRFTGWNEIKSTMQRLWNKTDFGWTRRKLTKKGWNLCKWQQFAGKINFLEYNRSSNTLCKIATLAFRRVQCCNFTQGIGVILGRRKVKYREQNGIYKLYYTNWNWNRRLKGEIWGEKAGERPGAQWKDWKNRWSGIGKYR